MLDLENNKLKNLKSMLDDFNHKYTSRGQEEQEDKTQESLHLLFSKLSALNTICEQPSSFEGDKSKRDIPSVAIDLSSTSKRQSKKNPE